MSAMATITKEFRFAMDEKGMKTLAPTLVGQTLSYWDNDRELRQGLVKYADVARDRYGNPFIEVEMEPIAIVHAAAVPDTGAGQGSVMRPESVTLLEETHGSG